MTNVSSPTKGTPSEYPEELNAALKELDTENFDYSEFSDHKFIAKKKLNTEHFDYPEFSNFKFIGKGKIAQTYSAIFKNKMYALKILPDFDDYDLLKKLVSEHSKNILINDNKALIAEFGITKSLSYMKGIDMVAYIDPYCILQSKMGDMDMKADIYSLGMIFWELTSGVRPYIDLRPEKIIQQISAGELVREKTAKNTPPNYANLYERCWSHDRGKRPTTDQILEDLEKLNSCVEHCGKSILKLFVCDLNL
ncbi:3987_t:CDS:2 [Cetraspora pellucida]|uniref:3987_t:CDS:1 n=1 Tax=Cetraspora pellucida TaxID=1433469 RepID=A0ACA9KXG9_9GLOM|nr:3987_t:CDS:2 [Cetraspora pellucida]